MTICAQCGKSHNRRKFCSNKCKDRFHNTDNPRGYGLAENRNEDDEETIYCVGQDAVEDGWDGHKEVF